MLLAIDMGNSNIEFGLLEKGRTVFSERIKTDLEKTATEYAVLLHTILEIRGIEDAEIDGAIISSVVPPLTAPLKEAVKITTGLTPLVVGPGIKTGMKVSVPDPKAVGADLIVGSVAGMQLYGHPLIVIDMGTATTAVVVDKEGTFIGGAVIPGAVVSLNALSNSASKLPMIDIAAPKKVINGGTVEAMQSGLVYGQASLLDGMIAKMKKEMGYDMKVVATGGLAKLIVPYCESEITLDNNLMLEGLDIIYNMNK
ncbi:MAG: type III pantothenate kinase [Erysipelotrichaceae bacterium]|nr:type III pantothenate kinase [Erysipelotrichaceae bacterium]